MARRLRSFRGQGCEQVMVGRVANQRAIEKGCDFGYALAANSCEGVTGVDACTVTALGSITAFAASEPRRSSRNAVGFFGSGRPAGRPDPKKPTALRDDRRGSEAAKAVIDPRAVTVHASTPVTPSQELAARA